MARNRLRDLWQAGGTALGAFIFTRLDPVIVEALAAIGYDYVCIDLQHGLMDFSEALAMLQALALGPTTPLVRVPSNETAMIGRVLDAGALGVIVPMVNTTDDAARAAAACRYAPVGVRSFGPLRAAIAHGGGYASEANGLVLCIPMIETAEAVANVAQIAAVPGVDALYIGPTDLSLTYGQSPTLDNGGSFAEALAAVVAVAAHRRLIPGIHANAALAARRCAAGFRMVTVANDLGILNSGFAAELMNARAGANAAAISIATPGAY